MRSPHFVVVAAGTAGDMYPFVYLARGLIARGHRVSVLGPAAHAGIAEAAEVPFFGLGTEAEYLAALDDPDIWHPRRGFETVWRHMLPGLSALPDWIAALPADEPLALLAHPLGLPAAALARAARPRTRVVTAWLAPNNLRTVHDPMLLGPMRVPRWMPAAWRHALWRLADARIIDPGTLPSLNATRAAAGLPEVDHFISHMQGVADASLALFPSWYAPTMPDWPGGFREGAFPLYDPSPDAPFDAGLESFLAAGDDDASLAPVVFTPGSGNRQAARHFERALAAVTRLGRRAIFLTPHRAQVPERLPPDVLWHPYLPLRRLLPRVAALVHHGGIGTTAEALRAGVPQLVLPLAFDQFDNGVRLEGLGVGRMLQGWRTRPRGLARAIEALLRDPATRAACARAAGRIAADAAVDLVGQVEALLLGEAGRREHGVRPEGQTPSCEQPPIARVGSGLQA
jgi:rhamnosyltransferase subunit B